MKKIFFALLAGVVGLSSFQAVAEDEQFSLDAEVAYNSAYMFRGINNYDGPSIQPSVTGAYGLGDAGELWANVWNHNSADNGEGRFTEVDFTLAYTVPVDIVSVSAGYIWYRYQNDTDDFGEAGIPETQEYFVGLALEDTILNPKLTYYRDIDAFDGNYFELTLSEKLEEVCGLGEGFNITPYVTFGFADNYETVYADDGFVQATFGVSSDLKLGDFAVTPSLNYTAESDDAAENQFWFGFKLGYSFM